MPAYNKTPFAAAVKLLYAGVCEYLFGSWPQDKSPTQMYVTSVAVTGNVATVGVVVYGGDAPAVGSLLSIQGTQSNGGIFNVTNAVLTGVTLNSAGVGTVTFAFSASANLFNPATATQGYAGETGGTPVVFAGYWVSAYIPVTPGQVLTYGVADSGAPPYGTAFYSAALAPVAGGNALPYTAGGTVTVPAGAAFVRITGTDNTLQQQTLTIPTGTVATTPDAGVAIVPQPVQKEVIYVGASVPVAMSNNSFGGDLDRTVTAVAYFGTLPTALTVTLQGAMTNEDAAYVNVGTLATVAGSAVTANGLTVVANYLFYRAINSGLTGSGTMAVQIEA
jgi:hypothetical protein